MDRAHLPLLPLPRVRGRRVVAPRHRAARGALVWVPHPSTGLGLRFYAGSWEGFLGASRSRVLWCEWSCRTRVRGSRAPGRPAWDLWPLGCAGQGAPGSWSWRRAGAAPPPFLSQLSAEWVAQGPPWVRQQGTAALALSSPQDGEDGLGGLPLSAASGTPPSGSGRCLEPAFSAIPRGRQRPEGWKRRLCRGPPPWCACLHACAHAHTHAHACTPLIGRRLAALC